MRFSKAEHEFRRMLALDPDDAFAHLGLGQLAARKGQWNQAEALLRRSIDLGCGLLAAHHALGGGLAKQARRGEAIAACERSLTLGLTGRRSPACRTTTC